MTPSRTLPHDERRIALADSQAARAFSQDWNKGVQPAIESTGEPNSLPEMPHELVSSSHYYSTFRGSTFVIQVEAEAVEQLDTTRAILQGIGDLRDHGIRVMLVLGIGGQFVSQLSRDFGATPHPETNRLIIPEPALPHIRRERQRLVEIVLELCRQHGLPGHILPETGVRAERRIGHGSTGVIVALETPPMHRILDQGGLAMLAFGGTDERGDFLYVPSTSLATECAVQLGAQKLLFLTNEDNAFIPDGGDPGRPLSFADLDHLLCLLQRRDASGGPLLAGGIVSKVHASVRAVAGGVHQVHLVPCCRLLEEILTRTGVGTMIECRQTHHVDYAQQTDLPHIVRLHAESLRYTSRWGTPYVKPLSPEELERLLPQTLLLKHRGVIIGKLHAAPVPAEPETLQIGGFTIGENHQDSQQGQLLLSEALARLSERGYRRAVAITASPRAQSLFRRLGGVPAAMEPWQHNLLVEAQVRYAPAERSQVMLVEFPLGERGV